MFSRRDSISVPQWESARQQAPRTPAGDLPHQEALDAMACEQAALNDLNAEQISDFARVARQVRNFPLAADAKPKEILQHLHLLDGDRVTNAAVLLFGKDPQRFLSASGIRCTHFHGAEPVEPMLSSQMYKGSAFDLFSQAVNFVLGRIDRHVGTRAESVRAPRTYELPVEVVEEAIINAMAHRDYAHGGNVLVTLFADRLEVWNPGQLAPESTLEQLRTGHGSVPANRLLAKTLYLAEYMETMGVGTLSMLKQCSAAGLPEPEFSDDNGFAVTIWRAKRRRGPGLEHQASPSRH